MSTRTALVTGAARGIGKGTALALGEGGATVHVSDRESRDYRHIDLPGTVEDTARDVGVRGGNGVAHVVDHTDDFSVQAMFDDLDRRSVGLDVVVANAFNGNALPFVPGPFWQLPMDHWRNMIDAGLRSHLLTARCAAPMLIQRGGILVMTGFNTPASSSLGHVFYDLAMASISRLGLTMANDLEPHGVAVVTLSPGFTRTEAILAAFSDRPLPPGSQSVELCGQVVRQLVADPDRLSFAGRTLEVAALADHYGITDHPYRDGS